MAANTKSFIWGKPALHQPNATYAISLELPAAYQHLNIIRSCIHAVLERASIIREIGADWTVYQIELAVQELCTNIIDHAYAGEPGTIRISIGFYENEQMLAIELRDTGAHFDPSLLAPVALDEPKTSGYGLYIIHQLMDRVIYQPLPKGNHWRLEKKL
jgi:serine/threonine-protein kinase RsbW